MGIFCISRYEQWQQTSKGGYITLVHNLEEPFSTLARPIVLIGGVHGDEPEGVYLAESLLDWLCSDEGLKKTKVPWVVIPCLNPDGYSKGQRTNGNLVDLNRNYPSENWTSEVTQEKYHPGPGPGSEAETQCIVELIHKTRPRLLIHCHSWKPMVVCTGDKGLKDAQRLESSSGYKVVHSIGYPTPGSLSHFGWHDHGIPVICTEEAENVSRESTWKRFRKGLIEIFADGSDRR